MKERDLIELHPRLWHMAMDGSWPSIRAHGLLSTSKLLDLYGIEGRARSAIEDERRPESVPISGRGLPGAKIRDQKPISDAALKGCLKDGLTPSDWYKELNGRVFFWPSRLRLRRLLGARAYRSDPQVVITVRTSSLIEAHRGEIELSPINSGSTIMSAQPRGRTTFLPINQYPFDEWKKKRSRQTAIAEITVRGGVPSVEDHVLTVHRVYGGKLEEIWRSPDAGSDDTP